MVDDIKRSQIKVKENNEKVLKNRIWWEIILRKLNSFQSCWLWKLNLDFVEIENVFATRFKYLAKKHSWNS